MTVNLAQIQARAALELRRRKAPPIGLLEFIPQNTPTFDPPEHLLPLIEPLEASLDEEVRIVTSVPPQHGKSQTILHGLVWLLLRQPRRRHAYITYATDFAHDQSYIANGIALRAGLNLDVDTLDRWVTPEGGGVIFTGIGGPVGGRPIDGLLVVDDPLKNRGDAESATIRNRVFEFLTSTAFARLHPGASVIVNSTRWHVDDPNGRLEEQGWKVVNLPAINEDGEALWPGGRPLEWLERQKVIVGPYDWASLYMGEPYIRGGSVFTDTPARYERPRLDGGRITICCDLAASTKTSADRTVYQVWAHHGAGDGRSADVLEVRKGNWDIDSIHQVGSELQKKYKQIIDFEQVMAQVAVIDELRKRGLRLKTHQPRGDKFARALPAAAAWNAGRIRLPLDAPWLDEYIEEHIHFTGTKADLHDDQVDTTSDSWKAGEQAPRKVHRPGSAGAARVNPAGTFRGGR